MGVTIQILGNMGEVVKSYRIKDYDELTLDDWKDLTIPKIDVTVLHKVATAVGLRDALEPTYELLKRHTGIPKATLKKLPPDQAEKLIDSIGSLLAEAVQEGAKKNDDYVLPAEVIHQGLTYTVPIDMEKHTIWHQWEEVGAGIELEHEADVYRHFLSILLVQKGKDFDPKDVSDKYKAFGSMLMVDVFPLCAFFFASNERFRTAINLCSSRYVTSVRLRVRQALRLSPSDGIADRTEESMISTDLLN